MLDAHRTAQNKAEIVGFVKTKSSWKEMKLALLFTVFYIQYRWTVWAWLIKSATKDKIFLFQISDVLLIFLKNSGNKTHFYKNSLWGEKTAQLNLIIKKEISILNGFLKYRVKLDTAFWKLSFDNKEINYIFKYTK